jgi:fatty acid desaturase
VTSRVTPAITRARTQTSKETRVANVEAREGVHRRARIAGLGLIMGFFAVAGLTLAAASLLVIGGVILALLLFFPLFLLGLVGVLVGLEDHTVQQHNPSMDGTKWRNGSSADR